MNEDFLPNQDAILPGCRTLSSKFSDDFDNPADFSLLLVFICDSLIKSEVSIRDYDDLKYNISQLMGQ